MDYQSLYQKTVVELRKIAKEQGVRIPAGGVESVDRSADSRRRTESGCA